MHLTLFTDYALRTLVYVAARDGTRTTSAEVAKAFDISEHHAAKAAQWLSREGYVLSFRGKGGGIVLARPPEEIEIAAVVQAAEPMALLECFEPETNTCPIAGICRLERLLHQARTAFIAALDGFTIADVIRNRNALLTVLGRPAPTG